MASVVSGARRIKAFGTTGVGLMWGSGPLCRAKSSPLQAFGLGRQHPRFPGGRKWAFLETQDAILDRPGAGGGPGVLRVVRCRGASRAAGWSLEFKVQVEAGQKTRRVRDRDTSFIHVKPEARISPDGRVMPVQAEWRWPP